MLVQQAGATQDLAESLLDAMSALRRALRRQAGSVAEVAALTTAQLQLVRVVHRRPGLSVADAADELGVAPNTVSTLVHQLLQAGVLQRQSSPSDRRVAQLMLVPQVEHRLGEWVGRRSDAVAAALSQLPLADRDAIARTLAPLGRLAAAVGGNETPA